MGAQGLLEVPQQSHFYCLHLAENLPRAINLQMPPSHASASWLSMGLNDNGSAYKPMGSHDADGSDGKMRNHPIGGSLLSANFLGGGLAEENRNFFGAIFRF